MLKWYGEFILEFQGARLSECAEKITDDIIKEVKEKYTTKNKEIKATLSKESERKIK
jgi:hypothetical protein